MEGIIFILLLMFGLYGLKYLGRWIMRYYDFSNLINENNSFIFLLVWIVYGFFEGLDYTERFGCIVDFEPIFSAENISYSTISFILILSAFLIKIPRFKKVLFSTELIYWISKLMIFKGGYVVGIGGVPDSSILLFDFISILLRLYILTKIFKFNFAKIENIALLIIGIKVLVFYVPMYDIYKRNKEIEKAKIVRKEIIGEWIGKIKIVKDNRTTFEKVRKIKIDSDSIKFDNIDGFKSQYQLLLDYSNYGELINENDFFPIDLSLNSQKDSLIIQMGSDYNGYKFELKRK